MKTLIEALEKLATLGNGASYGNSVGNEIARRALEKYDGIARHYGYSYSECEYLRRKELKK